MKTGAYEGRSWNSHLGASVGRSLSLDTELPRAWERDSSLRRVGRDVVAKAKFAKVAQLPRQKVAKERYWISLTSFLSVKRDFLKQGNIVW